MKTVKSEKRRKDIKKKADIKPKQNLKKFLYRDWSHYNHDFADFFIY